MNRKLEASYAHLFAYIDEHVLKLEPASFMTDFERGMRNALKTVWPAVEQYTCWFHFCQAVKRHSAQIPEFMSILRNEAATLRIYYEVMCLPLLPPTEMRQAFEELKTEAVAKHGTLYETFMRYIESHWMKKVKIAYTYPKLYIFQIVYIFLIGRARKDLRARPTLPHNIIIRGI